MMLVDPNSNDWEKKKKLTEEDGKKSEKGENKIDQRLGNLFKFKNYFFSFFPWNSIHITMTSSNIMTKYDKVEQRLVFA